VIVRRVSGGVELTTQPDHAQLAGTIMDHCVPLRSHPRRGAILHAIAEHDNGWAEEDAAPTVDPTTGNVADFITVALSVRHAVWPRLFHRRGISVHDIAASDGDGHGQGAHHHQCHGVARSHG